MKILSVDWAFHTSGIALYDSETKTITTTIWKINRNVKINWWNIHFYKSIRKELTFNFFRTCGLPVQIDHLLIEVGFGKMDKMSLFYAWFYQFWLDKGENVSFVNSQEWIKKMLKVNNVNKLKKGQDKQLLKELFNKRFNTKTKFSQDEIDAIMMLLYTYPNLEVKNIIKK